MGREVSALKVTATYNLVFNASLLVEEGLGYALCLDKLINTQGSRLCFRPVSPPLEASACIVWKKYQVFSKAAETFLNCLRELLENPLETEALREIHGNEAPENQAGCCLSHGFMEKFRYFFK